MKMKRVLALLLCVIMILSTAGCASKDKTKSSSANDTESVSPSIEASSDKQEQEIVTLTCYSDFGFNSADSYTWFQNILKKQFGFKMESRVQANDPTVLNTLLVDGKLTDIIAIKDKENVQTAVKGNMLLNLDDYKDKLPNIYDNPDMAMALEYARKTFGGVYMLPMTVGSAVGINQDPQLRYDLYKKLGMPKMKDMYDMLDVLKDMHELEPETKEGLPTYGMGAWNDWDGNMFSNFVVCDYMQQLGWTYGRISPIMEQKADGSEMKCILDDNSIYYQGLKWGYTANQMGLLDPEGATMTWSDFEAKVKAGQYHYTPFAWWNPFDEDADDWKGYASIWSDDIVSLVLAATPVGQGANFLGLSAHCEYVDKALAYLNWMYSDEGFDLFVNGPKGISWDTDKNGNVYMTDAWYEAQANGTTVKHPDGGELSIASIFCAPVYNDSGLRENGKRIKNWLEPTALIKSKITKLDKDYMENYNSGYKTRYDRACAEGNHLISTTPVFGFVSSSSTEIEDIRAQIGSLLVATSWKMIYAKNEAEFNSLWKQLKDDAEALGLEKVVKDAESRWQDTIKLAASYGIK